MHEESKKEYIKISTSLIIFICAILFPNINNTIEFLPTILYLISYLIVGFEIIKKAFSNILKGKLFDENFLMTLATVAAFVIKEYPEAVMVMWLYQVGEFFQHSAVHKSRKSITDLMNIRVDYATIEKDVNIVEVAPDEVEINDIIVVKPGEIIPLDGIIVEGESTLDTAALTGESVPRKVSVNAEVFSGCINKTGLLKIKVTKLFKESTVSKILELIENASNKKTKAENFISKFAKYYTPIVVMAAIGLAIIPPLFIEGAEFAEYVYRACSFLVISCPCALVISIPLSFFAGIGGASKLGVLIKGSNYIETLSKAKTIVLDKTGTLTKGNFKVTKINPVNITEDTLLEITALAEAYSTHPIANSIRMAYNKEIDTKRVVDVKEISGHGINAIVDGKTVYAGNGKLMKTMNVTYESNEKLIGTVVYVALAGKYVGNIVISDEIKEESYIAIEKFKNKNAVEDIVMLTGDNKEIANKVAEELGINKVHAELLPNNKVERIEELIKDKKKDASVVFVGDGINDAPVLTRADIGIAMGGLGSDAAIEAADVVIMDDNIAKISTAITLSKRTIRIVKQNIIFALAVKAIVLVLGAYGLANMWQAVFADVGVALIAIMNSMRAMKVEKYK